MPSFRALGLTGAIALATVGGATATAFASGAAPTPGNQALRLDSYEPNNDGAAGPVRGVSLPNNKLFVAEVQGTFSYYSAINWVHPQHPWHIVCGTALAAPMFQSPDRPQGGKVGFDAEFVFGRPWRVRRCNRARLPVRWGNFQINTGFGWSHHDPLGGIPTAPSAEHAYSYALRGTGSRPRFRLLDRQTDDNYGVLHIHIRRAVPGDCANDGWQLFGSRSQQACQSATS